MKQLLLFSIGFLLSYMSYSQDILSGLKSGNAKEIAEYFDNTIEITLKGKNNSYDKKKAEDLLQSFFTEVNVKGFRIIHESASGSSQYYIGNLITADGPYRTTVYTKEKNKKTVIQEIRFEK
ncbi:MAG: DUF4783 domain-containing protein [Ginsengibacter sp.]